MSVEQLLIMLISTHETHRPDERLGAECCSGTDCEDAATSRTAVYSTAGAPSRVAGPLT
jgi:hypothetical protein